MAGHVFLTRGDLTKLYCDAWLVPTDVVLSGAHRWLQPASAELTWWHRLRDRLSPTPPGWGNDGVRVITFDDWDESTRKPRPYLVNVGGVDGTKVEWYLEGARQFFQAVVSQQRHPGQVTRRAKPLLGLPVIGVGRGFAHDIKGDILLGLIKMLYDTVNSCDLDVVLVTHSAPMHAAAQNARRQYLESRDADRIAPTRFDLRDDLRTEAKRLAAFATSGRLVLFLGAGVSQVAGLPSWDELLASLAIEAGLKESEREAFGKLDSLDKARIVEYRLRERGVSLGTAISRRLTADHYSISHGLLASLPVTEAVTMNYGRLFEMASTSDDYKLAVLPYQPMKNSTRWLLKMHGCVTRPNDIVLTREDYLRYSDRRAALAGIVQAMLITRHMLFVGFSLTDDNFQRIVDDVRKAIQGLDGTPSTETHFGTALLLRKEPLLEELWKGDLTCLGITDGTSVDNADAARQLEIFLDYLLAEATRGTSPLLDPAFDGVLTSEEREVRVLLERLKADAAAPIQESPAWRPIVAMLKGLGDPNAPKHGNQL